MKIQMFIILAIFFLLLTHPQVQTSEWLKVTPVLSEKLDTIAPTIPLPVWVYFTDKGPEVTDQLVAVSDNLLPRARQRRLRSSISEDLVDFYDIPVASEYTKIVGNIVNKVRHKSRWLNAISVDATKEQISRLQQLKYVQHLDLVFRKTESLPELETHKPVISQFKITMSNYNYGLSFDQNQQINVPELHDMGYNGEGILIAMFDAGFNNLEHEALLHLNILKTWDFVNNDSIVWDEPEQQGSGNHGTYTLSVLAGYKEGMLIGPAFRANFILAKTENTTYERHIEEDSWVAAAEWVDSLGADIISSSLGYRDYFTDEEVNYSWQDMDGNTTIVTIAADIAASRGILVVNSAGNEGASSITVPNTIIAPSDGDSVLSVGSVTADGVRSSFSSMGPSASGKIKPDVMARGSSTLCASPFDQQGYMAVSGTSLSCPLVAGAAALVWQANPTLTNMQVIEVLKNTADNAESPDNAYGWGIINTYRAATYYLNSVEISESKENGIEDFALLVNYPNPFNSSTKIHYRLLKAGEVSIIIFNNMGQQIEVLYSGNQTAGLHDLNWETFEMASGVYYIVLRTQDDMHFQKALLLK